HFLGKRDLFASLTGAQAPPARACRKSQGFLGGTDAVVGPIASETGRSRPPAGRLSPALSAHLSFVDARRGCRVVLVVTPRRMMEMDDEIAVVRNDCADRKVRRSRKDGPCVSPSSVTWMLKVSVRFGRASPRS